MTGPLQPLPTSWARARALLEGARRRQLAQPCSRPECVIREGQLPVLWAYVEACQQEHP